MSILNNGLFPAGQVCKIEPDLNTNYLTLLKEFFQKVNFEKNLQMTKSPEKFSSMKNVNSPMTGICLDLKHIFSVKM